MCLINVCNVESYSQTTIADLYQSGSIVDLPRYLLCILLVWTGSPRLSVSFCAAVDCFVIAIDPTDFVRLDTSVEENIKVHDGSKAHSLLAVLCNDLHDDLHDDLHNDLHDDLRTR